MSCVAGLPAGFVAAVLGEVPVAVPEASEELLVIVS